MRRVVALLCFTNADSWADEWSVACPTCGHDYSHIREAGTILGSDEYEARIYPNTRVVGTTPERRSALVIVFDGECGHSWEFRIQQHKGVNLVYVRPVIGPIQLKEIE